MQAIRGYFTAIVPVILAFGLLTFCAPAEATNSTDVIIQLRVAGDIEALRPIRSCLAEKLSQMPDVRVATASTDGTRFVVDIVAAKNANKKISAVLWYPRSFLWSSSNLALKKARTRKLY